MTPSLELVFVRGSERGILYVYDDYGSGQIPGQIDELRAIARTRYPDAELHERPLDGFFEVRDESGRNGCEATAGLSKQERRSFKGCEEADPPGIEQARSPEAFA